LRKSVHPSRVDGTVTAPPSKSVMLRAVAAGVLSDRPLRILNPSGCDDARSALDAARALGADVAWSVDGSAVTIRGGAHPRKGAVDCGESGLCLRMFAALAALLEGPTTLFGRGTLANRPVGPIEQPLADLGASASSRNGFPPVVVRGTLRGGRTEIDASGSSQFLTGLLLALPKAPGDSTLTVLRPASKPYIQMTLDLMKTFGIAAERDGFEAFRISGGQSYNKDTFRIEGDWSGAAFLLAAGALAGRVRVLGLDAESAQGDRGVVDVLKAAGAGLEMSAGAVNVSAAALNGFEFDAADRPDLVPPLAALAAGAAGLSVFRGASRLDHKESRRAETLAEALGALGIDVFREGDRLLVRGGRIRGGRVNARGDHRIAMAAAVAALAAEGPVTIEGAECADKSYPGFFEDLKTIGGRIDE
jgi:3-phosphoshikimate 1-carboxyvinyltransferase